MTTLPITMKVGLAESGPHVPTPFENLTYHYTDAGALLSIVTKRQLWATSTEFTNDLSEYALPTNRLRTVLQSPQELTQWAPGKPQKHIQALALQLNNGRLATTTSFSKHADALTQFRMYGPRDGGYAIGFPREYLARIPGLSILDCDYSRANLEAWCKSYVQDFLAQAERIDDGAMDAQQLHNAIYSSTDLFSRRIEAQVRFKANEFRAEEEVRLYRFGLCTKHRVSRDGNLVIPYEPFDLPNEKIPVKIICGPNRDPVLAGKSCWEIMGAGRAAGTLWNFGGSGYSSQFRT
jgi:hypothetical protein